MPRPLNPDWVKAAQARWSPRDKPARAVMPDGGRQDADLLLRSLAFAILSGARSAPGTMRLGTPTLLGSPAKLGTRTVLGP